MPLDSTVEISPPKLYPNTQPSSEKLLPTQDLNTIANRFPTNLTNVGAESLMVLSPDPLEMSRNTPTGRLAEIVARRLWPQEKIPDRIRAQRPLPELVLTKINEENAPQLAAKYADFTAGGLHNRLTNIVADRGLSTDPNAPNFAGNDPDYRNSLNHWNNATLASEYFRTGTTENRPPTPGFPELKTSMSRGEAKQFLDSEGALNMQQATGRMQELTDPSIPLLTEPIENFKEIAAALGKINNLIPPDQFTPEIQNLEQTTAKLPEITHLVDIEPLGENSQNTTEITRELPTETITELQNKVSRSVDLDERARATEKIIQILQDKVENHYQDRIEPIGGKGLYDPLLLVVNDLADKIYGKTASDEERRAFNAISSGLDSILEGENQQALGVFETANRAIANNPLLISSQSRLETITQILRSKLSAKPGAN